VNPAGPPHQAGAGGEQDPLATLAREAIETYVRTGRTIAGELPGGAEKAHGGVFVSLHLPDGGLRGCLGTIVATRGNLAEEVVSNAVAAASQDPRFLPVAPAELEGLHVSVDVLSPPEEIAGPEELDPKKYGVIVRSEDGRQALLLPDLAGVDTAERQLMLTCRKGGIDERRDRYRLYRFTVQRHRAADPQHLS
jgi:AmmeMemoRadiSam system protein A